MWNIDGRGGAARQADAHSWRRRDARVKWAGVLVSVGIHAVVLLSWPMQEISYRSPRASQSIMTVATPIIALREPEEVIAPPATPPEEPSREPVRRPTPRPADLPELKLDPAYVPPISDLSLLEDTPPAPPPLPVTTPVVDEWSTYEPITAATVQPDIRNRSEVRRFLERRYQPILSRTGATGSTMLRFWIDEGGVAQRILMVGSSGHGGLDELAMSVAEVIRFRPAILKGEPIRVVVDVPIRFQSIEM